MLSLLADGFDLSSSTIAFDINVFLPTLINQSFAPSLRVDRGCVNKFSCIQLLVEFRWFMCVAEFR